MPNRFLYQLFSGLTIQMTGGQVSIKLLAMSSQKGRKELGMKLASSDSTCAGEGREGGGVKLGVHSKIPEHI